MTPLESQLQLAQRESAFYQAQVQDLTHLVAGIIKALYDRDQIPWPDQEASQCGMAEACLAVYLQPLRTHLPWEIIQRLYYHDVAGGILSALDEMRQAK